MKRAITIAGGGLAGLSLGIALRRHDVPVELHEAGNYPRHRVCGEFICGVEERVLESLGIGEFFSSARLLRSTVWYLREKPILRASLPKPAWGISRHRLDDALRRRFVEKGGKLFFPSRRQWQAREGLVWCAGRSSSRSRWLGLKCHVRGIHLAADLEMHLGSNGYAGLAQIDEETVNVCGLFRQDRSLAGKTLVLDYLRAGGLEGLAGRIEQSVCDEASFSAVAGFRLGWQRTDAGMAALGDACGIIPPFAGNGMSMAFESAEIALAPLLQYGDGRMAWKNAVRSLHKQLRRRFSPRMLWAGLLHPFLTLSAGQALLAAVARSGRFPFILCFRVLR